MIEKRKKTNKETHTTWARERGATVTFSRRWLRAGGLWVLLLARSLPSLSTVAYNEGVGRMVCVCVCIVLANWRGPAAWRRLIAGRLASYCAKQHIYNRTPARRPVEFFSKWSRVSSKDEISVASTPSTDRTRWRPVGNLLIKLSH